MCSRCQVSGIFLVCFPTFSLRRPEGTLLNSKWDGINWNFIDPFPGTCQNLYVFIGWFGAPENISAKRKSFICLVLFCWSWTEGLGRVPRSSPSRRRSLAGTRPNSSFLTCCFKLSTLQQRTRAVLMSQTCSVLSLGSDVLFICPFCFKKGERETDGGQRPHK